MNRIWKSSPLTKMMLSITFGFTVALLIFIGSLGIIAKIESLKNLVRTDLTNHQQLIVNSNIELLNDLYYIGNQKQLFDDLIEFFKSKDTKGLIDYE